MKRKEGKRRKVGMVKREEVTEKVRENEGRKMKERKAEEGDE